MTEKLYYIDSHLDKFSALVKDICVINNRCAVVLDKTAFFPEGGGQLADVGFIEGTNIYDVKEKDGEIYHFFSGEADFKIGDTVNARIDFSLRFARMQAHSGEHIVSGLAHKLFNAENVGFHMDGLLMTVDFDKVLTAENIAQLEAMANERVYKNLSVYTQTATDNSIDYRSKKDFDGEVRVVVIEDTDRCACCAPHVKKTGEIGLIKILSCVSHRGGVRITLICGGAAYENYCNMYSQILKISALLAAKHNEASIAVEKLLTQNTELKSKITLQRHKKNCIIADSVRESVKNIALQCLDSDMEDLREIALLIREKAEGVAIAYCGSDENGYIYALTGRENKLKKLIPLLNSSLHGRGGGNDEMLQGNLCCKASDIVSFFLDLEVDKL